MNTVNFVDLGRVSYQKAWDFQEDLFQSVIAHKKRNRDEGLSVPNKHYLLFCEHHHVFTLGKSGDINHLLLDEEGLENAGIEYYKSNRGGDITYHGPGQIVGYPILDLDEFFTDIHKYMRFLEEVIILTLADYGIKSERLEGSTGVWIDTNDLSKARKICAMGVRASRWVTMHGWALNVNTDLNYFNHIVPCGISDKAVTSLAKELGREIDMKEVADKLRYHFSNVFEVRIQSDAVSPVLQ